METIKNFVKKVVSVFIGIAFAIGVVIGVIGGSVGYILTGADSDEAADVAKETFNKFTETLGKED